MSKKEGSRDLDIVVLGATGFTGKLVCQYLATNYEGKVKWAMAGRSQSKLDGVKAVLTAVVSSVKGVPTIVADAKDPDSLKRLASQCKVVISTVGPFYEYGDPVVDACIAEGTHYCDTTAEVHWVRQNALAKHDTAAAKGVKIVHMCGLTCLPQEIAAWLAVRELHVAHGQHAGKVRAVVMEATMDHAIGGMLHEAIDVVCTVPMNLLNEAGQPYAMNAPKPAAGPDKGEQFVPSYVPQLGVSTAAWITASSDARGVRRGAALLDNAYGPNFSYDVCQAESSLLNAWITTVEFVAFLFCLLVPPLRWVMRHVIPKRGEGPSQEVMDAGKYTAITLASGEAGEGQTPAEVRVKFDVKGADAPYKGTATMIAESAMCLLHGANEQFGSAPKLQGGILTPAAAFGGALVERLNQVDNFEVAVVSQQKA